MSTNCIKCVVRQRTGFDLLCDECRQTARDQLAKKLADAATELCEHGDGDSDDAIDIGYLNSAASKLRRGEQLSENEIQVARDFLSEPQP